MQTTVQVHMSLDQTESQIRRAAESGNRQRLTALAGKLRAMGWRGEDRQRVQRLLGMVRRALQRLPAEKPTPAKRKKESDSSRAD